MENYYHEKYDEFINSIIQTRGQGNIPEGEYGEGHHIIPKSLGGEGEARSKHSNIIWLYAKEHFIAHKLLAEENPDNYKLCYAFQRMVYSKHNNFQLTEEDYEEARIYNAQANKIIGEQKPESENRNFIKNVQMRIKIYLMR